jgi:hypothetical protein
VMLERKYDGDVRFERVKLRMMVMFKGEKR